MITLNRINMLAHIQSICNKINNNNKIQSIRKNFKEEWEWIQQEVDILFPSYSLQDNEILFLLMNPNTELVCKCANRKRYYNGRYWCSKSCEYTKQDRKNTVMKKYGTNTYSQTLECKEKIRNTNLENLGVENPSQAMVIKEKKKRTTLKNFGCEYPMQNSNIRDKRIMTYNKNYGVDSFAQKNYSDLAKEILFDREKFKHYLTTNDVSTMADLLNISESTICVYHKKYDLNIIQASHSSYEESIKNWFAENEVSCVSGSRKIIPPMELDLYLPDHNLAIEFDGLYWHSEAAGKDKNYHLKKTMLCKEKGIRLVHIFEDEWVNNKAVCLDVISRILGINQRKLFARKCKIKELSNNEVRDFLTENHLQGYTSASINLGLIFENELVQLLTFKHARYNKNIEWELIRQVNKIGIQIVGGVQKLWSYFKKTYKPQSVVSYCDLRWFSGGSYLKMGFTIKTVSKPNYWYIFGRMRRVHRSSFTKKKCLSILLKEYNMDGSGLTERIITRDILRLNKIWDCGQQTWIWKA